MAKNSNRFYGTGRRKSSIARVYLVPGTGKVTINKKDMDEYFGLDTLKLIVKQPFAATGTEGKFDVLVNVKRPQSVRLPQMRQMQKGLSPAPAHPQAA